MEEKRADNNSPLKEYEAACYHCGLPARKISGEEKTFCCQGCKTACELIYLSGAGSYYRNRTSRSEIPAGSTEKSFPYDSSVFREQYLEEKDGFQIVTLHLENIHCASCIWVIEKVLLKQKGISKVSVNFSAGRAKITFAEHIVTLEEIVVILVKLGYPPTPLEKINSGNQLSERNKGLQLKMVIAAFGMLATMFLAEPFYFEYVQDLDVKSAAILRYVSLLVSTPVFFYCISAFFRGMLPALRAGVFTMDFSVFTGALLIYLYSAWSTVKGEGNIYYDCLTMFLFLILLGRLAEGQVQQKIFFKAGQAIRDYPKQATIVKGDKESLVHIEEVKTGDLLIVRPGELIPADGLIESGSTSTDESLLTGESRPVLKKAGNKVLGGSLNKEGCIYFKVTGTGTDTTIRQIAGMVDDIGTNRTRLQSLADKTAHYFIMVTLFTAMAVYLFNFSENPDYAMLTAISVIVVTCPCALGLAMPAAISLSTAMGVKKGILFKNSEGFEKLNQVNYVVLDKTGTITTGKAEVTSVGSLSGLTETALLEIAAAVERYSEHPAAWAIVSEASKRNVTLRKAHDFRTFTGEGVSAVLDDKRYLLGKKAFLERNGIFVEDIAEYDKADETIVYIAENNKLLGYFLLRDKIRDNAAEVVEALKKAGIKTALLSGDKKHLAERTGNLIGVHEIISEVLPGEKAAFIENLKQQGYKVAMVGDGINDAPAMARADTGIAVSSGNNLAAVTADIIILNDDFSALTEALKQSATTYRFIRQNLIVSLGYNLLAVPFAALGFISPLAAAILMPLSSMIVLVNSLRITGVK